MILSRVLLHPQERFNLEDYEQAQIDILTDAQYFTKQFLANASYVLKGFAVSGVGASSPCTVATTNATLINANNSGEYSWYSSANGSNPISVILQPNQRNYLELQLTTADGTPLSRAFWDPSANSGSGAEFNQTVNTITDIAIQVNVNTTGFTGSANTIPLAFVDTDSSNTVKVIVDKRPLFFRLGQPGSPLNSYTWSSQIEPAATLTLSGVSGSFVAGETLTFTGGATAVCLTTGSTPINANLFSSDSFAVGSTVTGSTSGAHGILVTLQDAFSGADKDIGDFKTLISALQSEIKAVKGTSEWFNNAGGSVTGALKFINSCIVPSPTANKPVVFWSGTALSLTDSNLSPGSTDIMALARFFGQSGNLNLFRQDGQAGTSQITINDGQLMYITLPTDPTASVNYSAVGSGATNYKVVSRASFVPNDTSYWICYREGSKINFRGVGELEAGESDGIGDTVPVSLLNAIGLPDEHSSPAYSSNIRGVAAESIISRVGVLTNLIGDEQEDRTMFFKSDTPIVWSGTQLIFTSPITLEVNNPKFGSAYTCTIATTFSPINLSNGDIIYFNINRGGGALTPINSSVTPIPAQSQANRDIILLCKREDVSSGQYGEESDVLTQQLLYIPLHKQVLRNGQASYLGETGRSRGVIRVDYYDPSSTSLPTGTAVTVDGVAGANGDLVLFGNLSSGANRIYKLSGVGTALVWTSQYDYFTGQDPLNGEMVIVEKGNGFANQVGKFTGTVWNFNNTIRLFNGADYWELGSIISVNVANNTTSTVFTVPYLGSQNWQINYSIVRSATKESGTLYMTTDGTTVSVNKVGSYVTATGVTFSAVISGGNLILSYTSDASGTTGVMKLFTMRWSDSSGGPGGIPTYSGGGGTTVIAAGNPGDIQFKDSSGGLAADDRFQVSLANGAITFGAMNMTALVGPTTILDNQAAFTTLISFNATTYKRVVLEYSVTRNGEERVGRLLISNNGSIAGQSDDYVETNQVRATGVNFQAVYSGGNILIQYTSDSQSANGQFYYSMRAW